MSNRVRDALAAIDEAMQFAPKPCRAAMEQARDILAGMLDAKECAPEQRLADLMQQIKPTGAPLAHRRRLPDERVAITHKFSILGYRGHLTVGEYEDGSLGELFLQFGEKHSSRNPLLDQFAIAVSMLLQVGVPVRTLVNKFRNTNFSPSGFTGNPDIPRATSPLDYIFAWIAKRYLAPEETHEATLKAVAGPEAGAPCLSPCTSSPPEPAHEPQLAVAPEVAVAGQEAVAPRIEAARDGAEPEATAVEAAGPVFERCRGDGKHGCGHASHVGPCKAVAVAPAGPCRCTGTPRG
jgi:hypothetical protein